MESGSFELFLKSKPILLVDGMICFDEISVNKMLTDDKWKLIQKFVKLAHFVQEEEPYVAGNEKAKKLIEKIRKNKKENAPKQEEKANLHSILSGVAWRTDGIDSLLNKTIYQLYDGYYRLGFIDNYHQVCTGIYTGNVDGSKIKLPDINWANVIKIN
jgi:hypothetical protein